MEEHTRHLGPRLRVLNQAIVQEMERNLHALELTSTQSFVLHYLFARQEQVVYPKDIEKHFNLTHPTVSGILQRLETKDFISILPDSRDRRYKQIALTQRGTQCQQAICRNICSMEDTMLAGMSDAEIKTLVRLLDQAVDNLNRTNQKEESIL